MIYKNELEERLYQLRYDLTTAQLNNWEFDIACLEDEIDEVMLALAQEWEESL